MVVEDSTSLTPTPASFQECISQAQESVKRAISDGFKLIEVEFPPLPVALLEDVSSSADDITKANVNLGLDFAQLFALDSKIVLIYPDEFEAQRAKEILGTNDPYPNVTIHNLRTPSSSSATSFDQLFSGIFGKRAGELNPPTGYDYLIPLGFSCQELPDLEDLHAMFPDTPMIAFNCKLDAARGDLGLPAFPSRDLHNRFLSQFKPAYFLRTRSYAMSLPRPPFVLSYQGALFRSYPEPFQTLLDVGDGRYKAIDVRKERLSLGGFKELLTENLQLSASEDKDSFLGKARKGVVNKTWWERENEKEESDSWRT
ncbi:MAG: DUF1995 family protein [Bacteroidota bacterium]